MRMSWKKRLTLAGAMALALGIGAGAGAHAAETPKAAPPTAASTATPTPSPAQAKAVRDPSRRVPRYFGQLGITPAQREAIYAIRTREIERTDALKDQIAETQDKAIADCEAVLTDTQREMLKQRRAAALTAAEEKRMAKAVKPTTAIP
jgi:hypothetical protein